MNLGSPEILLILLVVLLLFGGKRLPELARNIGKGLAEFRRAMQDVQREIQNPLNDIPPADKPPASPDRPPSGDAGPTSTANGQPTSQPRPPEPPPGSNS
jgi:sec-independent protein translocase protein TatA